MPPSPLRNAYFHSPYGEPDRADPWDLTDAAATPEAECDYVRAVLLELERSGSVQGLRVLVTSSVERVPLRGDDVLVVTLHDEWSRVPAYAGEVLGVLKCYGTRPWYPWRGLRPSLVEAAGVANHVRVRAAHTAHALRHRRGLRAAAPDQVLPFPLGWFKQVDVPWTPFEERPYDAFFVGSLVHDLDQGGPLKRAARRLVGNPKLLSRQALLAAAEQAGRQDPGLRLRTEVSGAFHDVGSDQAVGYSRLMMSSRACLSPRGTSLETFRTFEALRVGTVPVGEPLPPLWFYDGAPVEVLRSWSDLPDALTRVLADPDVARRRHEACLQWWRDRCSPPAVAERVEAWLQGRRRAVRRPA